MSKDQNDDKVILEDIAVIKTTLREIVTAIRTIQSLCKNSLEEVKTLRRIKEPEFASKCFTKYFAGSPEEEGGRENE